MSFIKKLSESKAKEPINSYNMDVMVPTTILEFDLSAIIDNNELIDIMKQHKQEFPIGLNEYDSRTLHAWHSDWKTHLITDKFDPFINKIKSCLKGHYANLVLAEFWFNTYEDMGSARRHRHGLNQISGVYFVECDENSSPLVIDNNYKNIEHITIQPKPGKLVVFPGYTYHSVSKNTSLKRTSIAFNFYISYNDLTKEQVEERKKLCRGTDV
jgi:hypothetical protein